MRLPYLCHVRGKSRRGLAFPGDEFSRFPVYTLGEYKGERRRAVVHWKNTVDVSLTHAMSNLMYRWMREFELLDSLVYNREGELTSLHVVPAPSRWWRSHDGRFVTGHLAGAVAAALSESQGLEQVSVENALVLPSRFSSSNLNGRRTKTRRIRLRSRFHLERPVILVDDVVTTGATLAGAADALSSVGVPVVAAVALLAAPDPRKGREG